jgi:transcriptional regulator with XRE-family HTH domain
MNKPYHTRSLYIEHFAAYLKPIIAEMGGVPSVASRLGAGDSVVYAWCNGDTIPRLATLVKMSEVLGLNLTELLEAAGKPPIERLRRHTASYSSDSLPLLLSSWRTNAHHGDTASAARATGISRWDISRYIAGSKVPSSLVHVYALAKALEVEPADILLMSGITEADKIWQCVTGVAKILRDGLESVGVNHFSKSEVEAAAVGLGLYSTKIWSWIEGIDTPGIASCLKIAQFAPVNLRTILKATGVTPGDALALAKAARCQPSSCDDDLGGLLRSYRFAAQLSQHKVAEALGVVRTTVVRYESGENTFPIDKLVAYAKLTNAPLECLLTAALAA